MTTKKRPTVKSAVERGRIVAEVTKNWDVPGSSTHLGPSPEPYQPGVISNFFEGVIDHNAQRGYELEHWDYNSLFVTCNKGCCRRISETIIAVFKKTT